MEITNITVSYSRTQSLGNYSNVKPHISLTAVIEEEDDFEEIQRSLLAECKAVVHGEIDDALEFDGDPPMFYSGPLFLAARYDARGCVAVVPEGVDMPQESNWKEVDSWRYLGRGMRFPAALKLAQQTAVQKGFALVDCADGDLSKLPPLPDPGPEPAWHAKNLNFNQLRLGDETVWEELAQLEHVTADYLRRLYNNDAEQRLSSAELVELIRTNSPWPPEGRAPLSDYEDYDEEDDWEDDD